MVIPLFYWFHNKEINKVDHNKINLHKQVDHILDVE